MLDYAPLDHEAELQVCQFLFCIYPRHLVAPTEILRLYASHGPLYLWYAWSMTSVTMHLLCSSRRVDESPLSPPSNVKASPAYTLYSSKPHFQTVTYGVMPSSRKSTRTYMLFSPMDSPW